MYHVNKDDPDKFEIEKQLDGLDVPTAIALFPILENHIPIDESEVGLLQKNVSAEVNYERLINERKDLEILTPKAEYKEVSQKIHYRCKKCGNNYKERKDRLLTKQAGIGKPFECKGCNSLERKYLTQAIVLQKTYYYISNRNGKILNLIKPKQERRYVTASDKLHIKCENGHEWVCTHRFLHTGAWCTRCSSVHSLNYNIPKFPNIRKGISKGLEFYAWRKAVRYFQMELLFPFPDKPGYLCVCNVCKNSIVLTSKQLSQRKYLCLNRCVPSNMPSLTEAVVASEYFLGQPDGMDELVSREYAEALLKYNDWVRDKKRT